MFQYKEKVVQRSLKYTTDYLMKFNSYTLKEINSVLEKVVKSHVEGKGELLIILSQYESAGILVEIFLLLEIINS